MSAPPPPSYGQSSPAPNGGYYPRQCSHPTGDGILCMANSLQQHRQVDHQRAGPTHLQVRPSTCYLPIILTASLDQSFPPPPSSPGFPNSQSYPPPPSQPSPSQQLNYPPPPSQEVSYPPPPPQQQYASEGHRQSFASPPSFSDSEKNYLPEKNSASEQYPAQEPPPDGGKIGGTLRKFSQMAMSPEKQLNTNQTSQMPGGAPAPGHFSGAGATQDDIGTFNGGSYRISHRDCNTIITLQLAMGCPLSAKPGTLPSFG